MAVTVDGRTDMEKLIELLGEPEQEHLDFKEDVDLSKSEDKVKFVKDVVAMSNCPPGGYLLIGVSDSGEPVAPIGTFDRKRFDGARLNDLIRSQTEGQIQIISQLHEIEGDEVVLIYAHHEGSGLPVPMNKLGQYKNDKGKDVVCFRPGEVWLREGAQNVSLRWSHWDMLLRGRDQRIREEARADINSLIAELSKVLRGGSGKISIPLTVDMADEAFVEAMIANLETGSDLRIKQFLTSVMATYVNTNTFCQSLDKLTIVAVQALALGVPDITKRAVDTLITIYQQLDHDAAAQKLEVIVRAYVIGAAAVRCKVWGVIRDLVLRPYPDHASDMDQYFYSSWIREGQVEATRAELFPDDSRGSLMIPSARLLAIEHVAMRPDLPSVDTSADDGYDSSDRLLDSLCQFDILYCLVVAAEGGHHGGAYPASSAFRQERANPALSLVVSNAEVRRELLPESDDARVAQAMHKVLELAKRQSMELQFQLPNNWWRRPSQNVVEFIKKHQGNRR